MNEFYIYTLNMLPISTPDRGETWNPIDVCEYISRLGRERFDYAMKNQWITYNEYKDI